MLRKEELVEDYVKKISRSFGPVINDVMIFSTLLPFDLLLTRSWYSMERIVSPHATFHNNKHLCSLGLILSLMIVSCFIRYRRASSRGERGMSGCLLCPFLRIKKSALILHQKKCPNFGKKCYGLNSRLRCSFKSTSNKKSKSFILRSSSILCRIWNVFRSAPISRNQPCPKSFLVACQWCG